MHLLAKTFVLCVYFFSPQLAPHHSTYTFYKFLGYEMVLSPRTVVTSFKLLYQLHQVTEERLFRWRKSLTRVQTASLLGFRDHIQLDIPHLVGLVRMKDGPVAENSTREANKPTRDNHAPGEIRNRHYSKWAAADLRLRPRGLWDRPDFSLVILIYSLVILIRFHTVVTTTIQRKRDAVYLN